MRVQFCQPPPPLASYIELLTWYEDYMPDHAYERLLPQGVVELVRFQKAILAIGTQTSVDWMRLVHECGYYDQAHFIKDFKRFSGFSPENYLNARGNDLNYLPVR